MTGPVASILPGVTEPQPRLFTETQTDVPVRPQARVPADSSRGTPSWQSSRSATRRRDVLLAGQVCKASAARAWLQTVERWPLTRRSAGEPEVSEAASLAGNVLLSCPDLKSVELSHRARGATVVLTRSAPSRVGSQEDDNPLPPSRRSAGGRDAVEAVGTIGVVDDYARRIAERGTVLWPGLRGGDGHPENCPGSPVRSGWRRDGTGR
jgi:hypothetical protein